jgi:hypothetical protein
MRVFWLPLAEVAAILLASGAPGYALSRFLLPAGCGRDERAAWGFAIGLILLALPVPIAFLIRLPPAIAIVLAAALAVAASWFLRRAGQRAASLSPRGVGGREPVKPTQLLLLLLVAIGVVAYMFRALTEPMWSNDYLAIWGFKGKAIFGASAVPQRLFADPSLGFSHPEYPLGLPFLYAALSFLLGRWDDHAMALLFPFLQIATLLLLSAWLRRRGASGTLALVAVALLALFEPLYSAFLTGMADVPYAFATLLFGTAFADALDGTDPFAARRLALASFLAISTKNEGMILTGAGVFLCLFGLRERRPVSRRAMIAIAAPAILLLVAGRLWKGSVPLRDFDLAYLGPTLILELLPRVAEAIHTGFREVILPAWPGLLCALILIAAGRRGPAGDRLLLLASLCAAAYLLVPSLAVLGPDWLIRTSFARTVSALAPLTAAAIAVRLSSVLPARSASEPRSRRAKSPEVTEGGGARRGSGA